MPRFTTRVELHNGDADDYETLHGAMERQGFSRTISNGDGVSYQLPTAEYNFDGNETKGSILDKAKKAADSTGLEHSILVTESAGRTWSGLDNA